MAIFGCDFLQFLNRHVILPKNLMEASVFNEFHQQKNPLMLRDCEFEKALETAIENMEKEINEQKISKPKTEEEKR